MTDVDCVFEAIARIDGCERTKRRCIAVLETFRGQRVYFAYVQRERRNQARVARALLRSGMTSAEARDALVERFGLSRSNAYRVIAVANAMQQQRSLFDDG